MTRSRQQYPARPRHEVEALCPTPTIDRTPDCRNEPGARQIRLYRTPVWDALAVRSEPANQRRKTRDHNWVERSFRTTGRTQDNVRSGFRK
jgi:hypothetical protein